ncbi:MAG: cysteine desulfurase family protein [Candidatus Cloacimonadota bacterium]|nr:cysteine desulfurase family protein [Candidatus Cloacimonadota bacterium]
MKNKEIYLDACKTSKLDPEVLKEMLPYFTEKFWYPGNFTSIGNEIADALQNSKETIASSLSAKPKEIIFTSGGTDANNIALKGLMAAWENTGKHFITSKIAHPSMLKIFAALEKQGYEGSYISADQDGYLDLDELKKSIRKDTTLIAFTHVNHTLGTIQKIKEISEILKRQDHKINFFIDSCEAYAKIPINVEELGVDSLSISAHKFNGPKGVGALYIKTGTKMVQTQQGINRFQALKPGAINVPAIVGFAKIVELIFKNFSNYRNYLGKIQKLLYDGIVKNIPDIRLNGPKIGKRSPAHLNITFYYAEGEAIMMMLDFENIHVATGSACAAKDLKANYILRHTGRTHEECNSSIRFTLDKFISTTDVERTVKVLTEVIQELRRRSPLGKNRM